MFNTKFIIFTFRSSSFRPFLFDNCRRFVSANPMVIWNDDQIVILLEWRVKIESKSPFEIKQKVPRALSSLGAWRENSTRNQLMTSQCKWICSSPIDLPKRPEIWTKMSPRQSHFDRKVSNLAAPGAGRLSHHCGRVEEPLHLPHLHFYRQNSSFWIQNTSFLMPNSSFWIQSPS